MGFGPKLRRMFGGSEATTQKNRYHCRRARTCWCKSGYIRHRTVLLHVTALESKSCPKWKFAPTPKVFFGRFNMTEPNYALIRLIGDRTTQNWRFSVKSIYIHHAYPLFEIKHPCQFAQVVHFVVVEHDSGLLFNQSTYY